MNTSATATASAATGLLLYCRAGFEGECAKEIANVAGAASIGGFIRSKPGSGYVEFVFHEPLSAPKIAASVRFRDLAFARQMIRVGAWVDHLPVGDRVTPLLPVIAALNMRFSEVLLETADTNEAKTLSSFMRAFAKPLGMALKKARLVDALDSTLPRLHGFFTGSSRVCIGTSDRDEASPWPMGIPRLSMPRQAPSRSTLKLAEAIDWFLTPDQRQASMHEGITAVDLGASPGGWTYQLVKRGVAVTAVDNGPMDDALLDSGLVEHVRADGFTYRPRYPVEWMVCDIVEQPIRVARLVGEWIADGDCRQSIFNLKLPMKKRYDELARCRAAIEDICQAQGVHCTIRFKHLYHDREEVTGYIVRSDPVSAARKKSRRRHDQ